MCQKCVDDGVEYTHVSDLAMMVTEAFTNADGKDAPIILYDNAGDHYHHIDGVEFDENRKVYVMVFEWRRKYNAQANKPAND